jgi:hypothetical protein
MTNMSHCRFENTLNDLRDCEEHLADYDLSKSEKEYRDRLLKLCKRITDENMDT